MKLKMIFSLTTTCLLSAALLSFVYQKTDPQIQQDIAEKNNFYLVSTLFPSAKSCAPFHREADFWVAYDSSGKTINIVNFENIIPDTLWSVIDTAKIKLAIIFKVFPMGYGGKIPTLVALKTDTTVLGIRPITPSEGLKETPGLGTKINDFWFRHQFVGKKQDDIALKKDDGTLDAITSATVSSRAVANGVRDGVDEYKRYLTALPKHPKGENLNTPEQGKALPDTLQQEQRNEEKQPDTTAGQDTISP